MAPWFSAVSLFLQDIATLNIMLCAAVVTTIQERRGMFANKGQLGVDHDHTLKCSAIWEFVCTGSLYVVLPRAGL